MQEINSLFDPAVFKNKLEKLASWKMPFGKYQDTILIDLPEPYLLWFQQQGWPAGELGELLALALEIHISGSENIVRKLKK